MSQQSGDDTQEPDPEFDIAMELSRNPNFDPITIQKIEQNLDATLDRTTGDTISQRVQAFKEYRECHPNRIYGAAQEPTPRNPTSSSRPARLLFPPTQPSGSSSHQRVPSAKLGGSLSRRRGTRSNKNPRPPPSPPKGPTGDKDDEDEDEEDTDTVDLNAPTVASKKWRGKQTTTSDVWLTFEKLYEEQHDGSLICKEVQCKICAKRLHFSSSTSSLRHHRNLHASRNETKTQSNTILFDQLAYRRVAPKFIECLDVAISMPSSPA